LKQGFQYYFRVAAVNDQGQGDWSTPSSLDIVPRGCTLGKPNGEPLNLRRNFDVDPPERGKIRLIWDLINNRNDAGGDDLGDPGAGINNIAYEVEGGQEGNVQPLNNPPYENMYEAIVPAGQIWLFRVRVKNRSGQSSDWNSGGNKIDAGGLRLASATYPTAPRLPEVVGSINEIQNCFTSSMGNEEVTLQWFRPADDGDNTIRGYQISRDQEECPAGYRDPTTQCPICQDANQPIPPTFAPVNEFDAALQRNDPYHTPAETTVATDTAPANGKDYRFCVRAVNSVGAGPALCAMIQV